MEARCHTPRSDGRKSPVHQKQLRIFTKHHVGNQYRAVQNDTGRRCRDVFEKKAWMKIAQGTTIGLDEMENLAKAWLLSPKHFGNYCALLLIVSRTTFPSL